ncbi:Arabinose import ATP-binding protein AraG [Novipirellula galeiformis]|uniref:Arabinose import ATP-binding protein AraG n=1 Tax=Novipirellula galeiformis TaxID=2528004 RepID=A0A5C6CU19_9BACT|nr:sugar ABC transporter ATP-binding protein [Novipirellula galeiformis]TWU26997.1 Arabinose import ATP-binding protein AraG [Novipirellula galeiformis]
MPQPTATNSRTALTSPRLAVRNVSKRFPGVLALDEVSLHVMGGETLAVIGENGAGKSTLMKIFTGIEAPDRGQILLDGVAVHFSSTAAAISAGVSLIHQELNLHENLSVAENIFLGREPNRFGFVDRKKMESLAELALRRVGFDLSPRTSVATLSTASRQLVEVAKAISSDASVVIMDEPTSSLSPREAERLFEVVESLRAANVSVIYISHRLSEVTRLADRVEVLRDGRNAGTLDRDAPLKNDQIHHDAMVSRMVGRELDQRFERTPVTLGSPVTPGPSVLKVSGLESRFPASGAVDISLCAGEIVGIAGLMGSGRSELLESIFGVLPPLQGQIEVAGVSITNGNVREAIKAGLAFVPEDRKRTGLLLQSSIRENATIVGISDCHCAPWVSNRWQTQVTADLIDRLQVKTASQTTTIADLSGGNQQKIALGKWLIEHPKVLLLDEPTRGVDVGAKEEIYRLLETLANQGMAILFVSSEMEEVLALADRVIVMHEGKISGSLLRPQMSEEAIMRLAVGIRPEECLTQG